MFDQLSGLVPSSELNVEQLKTTQVNSCYQYLNHKARFSQLVTKENKEALRNLRNNEQILISRQDKGSGIVLIDKKDYVDKMDNILSDYTKFSKTINEKDKTTAIEKTISKLLVRMKKDEVLDSTTFERIRRTDTTIPRLYGLPKIHKKDVPLRPILDMVNSPYHALAKWLVGLLGPVTREIKVHTLKNTFQFIDEIKDLNLVNTKMFSLDVNSLFTKVPLKETIKYICHYIEDNNKNVGIPVNDLKQLLFICTHNVPNEIEKISSHL